MKEHVKLEDLSAYLDGEAENPAFIAKHLQQCAHCAKLHMQFVRLSTRLRELPEPDVRPSFATNVIGRVRDEQRKPVWAPFRQGFLAAAALLLVAGGVALVSLDAREVNAPGTLASEPAQADGLDGETLLAEIDTPYASDSRWLFSDSFVSAPAKQAEETDTVLAALASVAYFDDAVPVMLDGGQDMQTAVTEMSTSETETFLLLLSDFAREGTAS